MFSYRRFSCLQRFPARSHYNRAVHAEQTFSACKFTVVLPVMSKKKRNGEVSHAFTLHLIPGYLAVAVLSQDQIAQRFVIMDICGAAQMYITSDNGTEQISGAGIGK